MATILGWCTLTRSYEVGWGETMRGLSCCIDVTSKYLVNALFHRSTPQRYQSSYLSHMSFSVFAAFFFRRKVVSKTTNSYDGRSELNAKKVKSMVESYVKKYQEVARKDEQKKMKKELDNLVASKIGWNRFALLVVNKLHISAPSPYCWSLTLYW